MKSFEQKELLLSEKLRRLCNGKGEELFPEQSAHIFYELGLIYKLKSPNKISLPSECSITQCSYSKATIGPEVSKAIAGFVPARAKLRESEKTRSRFG